jgi:hypothetical protein
LPNKRPEPKPVAEPINQPSAVVKTEKNHLPDQRVPGKPNANAGLLFRETTADSDRPPTDRSFRNSLKLSEIGFNKSSKDLF